MSNSSDPLNYILDKLYELQLETKEIINKKTEEISKNLHFQKTSEKLSEFVSNSKEIVSSSISSAGELLSNSKLNPNSNKNLNSSLNSALNSNTNINNEKPYKSFFNIIIKPFSFIKIQYKNCIKWISSHKLTTFILFGISLFATGYYIHYYRQVNFLKNKKNKKNLYNFNSKNKKILHRRARHAQSGARTDVVVISGTPGERVFRAIVADLDKRGFIVYCVVSSAEEEAMIEKERSTDIRALRLNSSDSSAMRAEILRFSQWLQSSDTAFPGAIPHTYNLLGLVILPSMYYPTGPIETISLDVWNDVLYAKVMGAVALLSGGFLPLIRSHSARVIFLTPAILPALNPPFHSLECVVAKSLESLSLILSRELAPQNIPVINLRLGSFNLSTASPNYDTYLQRRLESNARAEILSWPEDLRRVYAQQYVSAISLSSPRYMTRSSKNKHKHNHNNHHKYSQGLNSNLDTSTTSPDNLNSSHSNSNLNQNNSENLPTSSTNTSAGSDTHSKDNLPDFSNLNFNTNQGRLAGTDQAVFPAGSNMKRLYYSLFDALTVPNPKRVWHTGKGSSLYDFIGSWMPEWLMGDLIEYYTARR